MSCSPKCLHICTFLLELEKHWWGPIIFFFEGFQPQNALILFLFSMTCYRRKLFLMLIIFSKVILNHLITSRKMILRRSDQTLASKFFKKTMGHCHFKILFLNFPALKCSLFVLNFLPTQPRCSYKVCSHIKKLYYNLKFENLFTCSCSYENNTSRISHSVS